MHHVPFHKLLHRHQFNEFKFPSINNIYRSVKQQRNTTLLVLPNITSIHVCTCNIIPTQTYTGLHVPHTEHCSMSGFVSKYLPIAWNFSHFVAFVSENIFQWLHTFHSECGDISNLAGNRILQKPWPSRNDKIWG